MSNSRNISNLSLHGTIERIKCSGPRFGTYLTDKLNIFLFVGYSVNLGKLVCDSCFLTSRSNTLEFVVVIDIYPAYISYDIGNIASAAVLFRYCNLLYIELIKRIRIGGCILGYDPESLKLSVILICSYSKVFGITRSETITCDLLICKNITTVSILKDQLEVEMVC